MNVTPRRFENSHAIPVAHSPRIAKCVQMFVYITPMLKVHVYHKLSPALLYFSMLIGQYMSDMRPFVLRRFTIKHLNLISNAIIDITW